MRRRLLHGAWYRTYEALLSVTRKEKESTETEIAVGHQFYAYLLQEEEIASPVCITVSPFPLAML